MGIKKSKAYVLEEGIFFMVKCIKAKPAWQNLYLQKCIISETESWTLIDHIKHQKVRDLQEREFWFESQKTKMQLT